MLSPRLLILNPLALAPALLLALALTLAPGCGGPATSKKADTTPNKAAAEPASKPAPAAEKPRAKEPVVPEGSIRKSMVMAYHKRGAQKFIASVRVKATFRRGKFFGWRILSYRGPGPIAQGDVVIDVIGMPLARPDQFMKVWEKLPSITELTVKLLRQDKTLTLSYPVVDDTRAMP